MDAYYSAKGALALRSAGNALSSAANSASTYASSAYQSAVEQYEESSAQRSKSTPPVSSSQSLRRPRERERPGVSIPSSSSYGSLRRTESPEPTSAAAAGWTSVKKAVWGEEKGSMSRSPSSQSAGEGGRWAKLMDAAYSATSTVSAKVVSRVTGNEEPSDEPGPDGDTHLTRVIKEYHISRASSADDLPGWLFPDRAASSRLYAPAASQPHRGYSDPASFASSSGSSSLGDIFDNARHGPSSSVSSVASSSRSYGSSTGGAADRLRAMRDQKRLAAPSSTGHDYEPAPSSSLRQPRAYGGGLPSGPRAQRPI